MTAIVNIKAQSNANLNLKVRSSFVETKELVDFTNYKADMEIRERKDGYVVLATLSSYQNTADGTIDLQEGGIFTLDLSPEVLTNKVKVGTWYYDIVMIRPDGVNVRWMEGKFSVDGSTTIDNLSTSLGSVV